MMWISASSYTVVLYNSNSEHTFLLQCLYYITVTWSCVMRSIDQTEYTVWFLIALACFLAGGWVVTKAWSSWLCAYVRKKDASSNLTRIWRWSTWICVMQGLVSGMGAYCQDDKSTAECRTTIIILGTLNAVLFGIHVLLLAQVGPFGKCTRAAWFLEDQERNRTSTSGITRTANGSMAAV